MYGFNAFLDRFVDGLINFPTKKTMEESIKLDLTKSDKIDLSILSINKHIQLELAGDKFIITIPETKDLFEPNSLFEKPLVPEDAEFVFALMNLIHELTQITKKYLDSRN